MKNLILTLSTILTLAAASGCAPQLQRAIPIGDREPATWVFISVEDKSYQGVYRCKETEEGPICQKAKLK
jgi:hypothetical protein